MSAYTMAEAWAPAEAARKAAAMYETWGHLEPPPGKYRCWMLFAHGTYGDIVVLENAFEENAQCCPGTYDDLQEYAGTTIEQRGFAEGLYEFTGYYQRFKNGKGRFVGKVMCRPFTDLRQSLPTAGD